MKKLVLFFIMILIMSFGISLSVSAKDVLPRNVNVSQVNTIGLYQVGNDVRIYKEPDENSQILYRVKWSTTDFFPQEIGFDKFFMIHQARKSLALVGVTDITDDWIEIVYDNTTGAKGWIQVDDPYKFMTWINFYNTYGKKYGLVMLNGAPDFCKDIKSATDETGMTVSTINYPKKINLNVIRGNWALVSVMDLDRTPKTGYVRWRSDSGVRYYFPNMSEN